ncbi:Arf-GAP with SH3 domain, ANK repeat and PH domain-containing protein 1, partial [Cichlidogyrus casuarinus]
PSWVSVNLGVTICVECCGTHRELGVHVSRTQSLEIDDLSISHLIVPKLLGNLVFNSVYEANLPTTAKPTSSPGVAIPMHRRRQFIREKYLEREYVSPELRKAVSFHSPDSAVSLTEGQCDIDGDVIMPARLSNGVSVDLVPKPISQITMTMQHKTLVEAVATLNVRDLLKLHAQKFDCTEWLVVAPKDYLPGVQSQEKKATTALHMLVEKLAMELPHSEAPPVRIRNNSSSSDAAKTCLLFLEFIILNCNNAGHLKRMNSNGDNALHHAVRLGCIDAVKLLLNAGGFPSPLLAQMNEQEENSVMIAEALVSRTRPSASSSTDSGLDAANITSDMLFDRASAILRLVQSATNQLPTAGSNSLFMFHITHLGQTASETLDERKQLWEEINILRSLDWDLYSPTTTRVQRYVDPSKSLGVSPSDNGAGALMGYMYDANECERRNTTISSLRRTATTGGTSMSRAQEQNCRSTQHFLQHSHTICTENVSHCSSALATLPRKRVSMNKGPAPQPPVQTKSGTFQATISPMTQPRKQHLFGKWPKALFPQNSTVGNSSFWVSKQEEEKSNGLSSIDAEFDKLSQLVNSRISWYQDDESAPRGLEGIQAMLRKVNNVPTNHATVAQSPSLPKRTPSPPKKNCTAEDNVDLLLDVLSIDSEQVRLSRSSRASSPSASLFCNSVPRLTIPPPPEQVEETDQSTAVQSEEEACSTLQRGSNDTGSQHHDMALAKKGSLVKALYDCTADQEDELSFQKDELIQVVERDDSNWWEGYVVASPERCGLFPVPFVRLFQI